MLLLGRFLDAFGVELSFVVLFGPWLESVLSWESSDDCGRLRNAHVHAQAPHLPPTTTGIACIPYKPLSLLYANVQLLYFFSLCSSHYLPVTGTFWTHSQCWIKKITFARKQVFVGFSSSLDLSPGVLLLLSVFTVYRVKCYGDFWSLFPPWGIRYFVDQYRGFQDLTERRGMLTFKLTQMQWGCR